MYLGFMSKYKNFLVIGTIGAVSMMGSGVAFGATSAAPHASAHIATAHVVKVKKVAFKGTYKGTIKLAFGASTVTASLIGARGTGSLLGAASTMTGTGTGADTAYSNAFSGTGVLAGLGSKLVLSIVKTASSASVADGTQSGPQSPPATVTVVGQAKVTSGAGKWKGATGTLKFSGTFSVKDSTAGTTETDSFTATMSGTLSVKH